MVSINVDDDDDRNGATNKQHIHTSTDNSSNTSNGLVHSVSAAFVPACVLDWLRG
jgi:hypothetical protein